MKADEKTGYQIITERYEAEKNKYKMVDEVLLKLSTEKEEVEKLLSAYDDKNYDVDDFMEKKECETRLKSINALISEVKSEREELLQKNSYDFVADMQSLYYSELSKIAKKYGNTLEEKIENLSSEIIAITESTEKEIKKEFDDLKNASEGVREYISHPEKLSFKVIRPLEEESLISNNTKGRISQSLLKEVKAKLNIQE